MPWAMVQTGVVYSDRVVTFDDDVLRRAGLLRCTCHVSRCTLSPLLAKKPFSLNDHSNCR